jgi:hypothetical protein
MLEQDLGTLSANFTYPRKPGILLLAHDLNILISSLIHIVKKLFAHSL